MYESKRVIQSNFTLEVTHRKARQLSVELKKVTEATEPLESFLSSADVTPTTRKQIFRFQTQTSMKGHQHDTCDTRSAVRRSAGRQRQPLPGAWHTAAPGASAGGCVGNACSRERSHNWRRVYVRSTRRAAALRSLPPLHTDLVTYFVQKKKALNQMGRLGTTAAAIRLLHLCAVTSPSRRAA